MAHNKSHNVPLTESLPVLKKVASTIIERIGEDSSREGLKRTPERFAKALIEMTSGYKLTGLDAIGNGIFKSESNGPVAVLDIEFFSLCEHHILPFWGKASIAYLPGKKILGLSKFARIVDVYAKRLQVQERLTNEIGECVKKALVPKAIAVNLEAQHMCMMMRGIGKTSSLTKTEFVWKHESTDDFAFNRLLLTLNKN